ncbi:hypothetical protein QQG55_1345 [Brugia pahangi]
MEIMRNGYCAIKSAILAVIEWRSAASAPYFMFINSAFWWSVFYLDKGTQLRLLISFAAGVFSWDILLSSTYDRSILCHILTWPIRSVLRTASVVMALYSAKFLYLTEFEKACWSAYSAAIRVRDSILWPFFVLLISLMHKVCAQLYRILLQPVIDILYEKYKVCEDYLLIYCLGPVCQVVVNHIPERSPFCDDTDTELADLLPPGFSNEEESDIEEASDKPSLPSRSLSPFTEDERDFVRGLKFPNLDSSDSSEAEFALRTKSNSQKSLRKRPKIHPKDPAPSTCSDKLISRAHKAQNDENKYKRSSSTSSHSESVPSSSAQNASDDADLQNLDAFDFESESCPGAEFQRDTVEIQKLEDSNDERSNDRKQNMDQKKMEEIEVCCAEQVSLATVFKDDSFEILDK